MFIKNVATHLRNLQAGTFIQLNTASGTCGNVAQQQFTAAGVCIPLDTSQSNLNGAVAIKILSTTATSVTSQTYSDLTCATSTGSPIVKTFLSSCDPAQLFSPWLTVLTTTPNPSVGVSSNM
jgi:hypothetical protein